MRRWIIGILIVIVLAGAAAYGYFQSQGGFPGQPAQGDATPTPLPPVEASSEIVAEAVVVPVRYAALSMATGGIVAEVFVQEGEQVEEGQIIARLDNNSEVIAIAQAQAQVDSVRARLNELIAGARPEEIAAAEAAVDAARANLAKLTEAARQEDVVAAQASLTAAQAALQKVRSGPEDEAIIAARAELENARAERQRAQNAYNEVRWRTDIGALPQSADLQRATNNFEAAQARYNDLLEGADPNDVTSAAAEVTRARANLDKTNAPGSANDVAAAEAEVRRAQANLDLQRAGARAETIAAAQADLTNAEAALMQQQVALDHTELRAPFSGTIALLDLRVGEQIAAGSPVVQLADTSTWVVETDDLTEISVVNVAEGDVVTVIIDALPDVELAGRVVRIKPFGENKQGDITYTVTIALDESDPRLRWNMTAAVTILAE